MNLELKISKELSTLSATALTWRGASQTVNTVISTGEFHRIFNHMIHQLLGCYSVVIDNFMSFDTIHNKSDFLNNYSTVQEEYQESFLQVASEPRHFADATYDLFLELSTMREFKTNYPLLKRTFSDLEKFVDKWVTGDAWIVMGTDVIFKSVHRILLEISNLKKMDVDDAWVLYKNSFGGFLKQIEFLSECIQVSPVAEPHLVAHAP